MDLLWRSATGLVGVEAGVKALEELDLVVESEHLYGFYYLKLQLCETTLE